MLLPSKAIPSDQAMIAVGAQILIQLDHPGTVSAVWQRLMKWREVNSMPSAIPFWWFALSVDLLYATGAVEIREGELTRENRVP
ncbi:ABC-three component system middle component 6 [Streptomyces sp. NPDC060209]|uniref:ABC-three component system middle component 6 n=1 Tax=Streptomyces sp. NPDC060209 TaxID=3347073 RepID=UPI00364D7FDA